MKTHFWRRLFCATLVACCVGLFATAESAVTLKGDYEKSFASTKTTPLFPQALIKPDTVSDSEFIMEPVSYAPRIDDLPLPPKDSPLLQSVLLNNDIFALYGKPGAYTMGVLGQYSLKDIEPIMNNYVRIYDEANGDRGIIPAFYIIYGTCWPEGEIGILAESVVKEYIEFAAERGWYVYLDHQIGRYSVESAVKKLLPYLQYPNVHLALDPEWRTTKPMQEIGSVTGTELNIAQQMIQNYLIEHNLPGRRMLVVHQFKPKMILDRSVVKSDFERVQIIHCADGFGSPQLKRHAYAANAAATNMPLKSFKLFTKPTVANAGYDIPLMTPEEVFELNPRPYLIMYQ